MARAGTRLSQMLGELVETAGQVVTTGAPVTGLVDVTALIGEILHVHGVLPPTLTDGVRPHAVTSPVLLRHLVDNLVANAATAAGPAAVTVEITTGADATVHVAIANPTEHAEAAADRAADGDVLHLDPGRGRIIATILADTASITYTTHHDRDAYTARLAIPHQVHHPSTARPAATDVRDVAGNTAPRQCASVDTVAVERVGR